MITKNQIDNWIALFNLCDNKKDFKPDTIVNRTFQKKDLLEAKVMIDRWDVVTTDWIFHTSKKDLLESLFPKESPMDYDSAKETFKKIGIILNKDINYIAD